MLLVALVLEQTNESSHGKFQGMITVLASARVGLVNETPDGEGGRWVVFWRGCYGRAIGLKATFLGDRRYSFRAVLKLPLGVVVSYSSLSCVWLC